LHLYDIPFFGLFQRCLLLVHLVPNTRNSLVLPHITQYSSTLQIHSRIVYIKFKPLYHNQNSFCINIKLENEGKNADENAEVGCVLQLTADSMVDENVPDHR
jgi:hypothetical protein